MLTDKQKKQLAWVEKWEYHYTQAQRLHVVRCKDCDIENIFVSADSVRIFITHFHNGHNTNYIARRG